ncbi:AraC family transcriptional regulator [Mesorhizobium escarrei]|uniref:AraC family transcriptional regulator n=2 Tax=Mesorhizobium escarrei TaxID=666018 RepID=A0ABM9DM40_9HYPH|nr:AraC family transcriptional regulator [Mesorhizobium escarrei]
MLTNSASSDIDARAITAFAANAPRLEQTGSFLSGDWRAPFNGRKAQRARSAEYAQFGRRTVDVADYRVEISSANAVSNRTAISDGIVVEVVQAAGHDKFEFRFRAPMHLLVVYEQGARRDGDTFVEGLSPSKLRDFGRKLTLVPAGREYLEWHAPRTFARLMFVYFDPAKLQVPFNADTTDVPFAAKLFFEDATLLGTALKLMRSLESPSLENRRYLEALGIVLAHELVRFHNGTPSAEPQLRGGLAAWQERIVMAHIDAHLGEPVPLAALAQLARLSPYYFCRAFKLSFGVPPHRYHISRRIEHAKGLLATRAHSVTDIGLTVGYSETSSFTAAFRKATGLTPSAYQRSLG